MNTIEKLIRKNILQMKTYSNARDEFSGKKGIFLDANENPYGSLNRYPDPHQKALKKKLSVLKKVKPENIFIGNGSDEIIDLCYRIFCIPGKDKALGFSPSYGMYAVSAAINDIAIIELPLDAQFQIDIPILKKTLAENPVKLLFICSPNNPTGNLLKNIDAILDFYKGIVLIDEAYIDFSPSHSFLSKINQYPNLIISQTFSKARGLAAARVGIAFAQEEMIRVFNKVKAPYNVSLLNQQAALDALQNSRAYLKNRNAILKEKLVLERELAKIPVIKKVFPSDANFILVQVDEANQIYQKLVEKKVITRNRNQLVKNCIRISIGKPEENKKLLQALNQITT